MPAICLFAKLPQPGRTKSRLARDIGDEAAAALSAAMLRDLACEVRKVGEPAWLWHPPGDDPAAFPAEVADFAAAAQQGADLGARMLHTMRELLPGKVVIIGSDCIAVGANTIRRALALLDEHDLVLQPSEDGGYTLIGMSRLYEELFEDIAWGTDQVWAQSVSKLEGISWAALPSTFDVDTVDDLARLAALVFYSPRPHTEAWLQQHTSVV